MKSRSQVWAIVVCIAAMTAQSALAQEVKITPLGGIDGELCPQDRALILGEPFGREPEAHGEGDAEGDGDG